MDDQSKLQKRTAKIKWDLSCFRKPDRQPPLPSNSIPPDAEPSNPIPPDADALSQPQSSSGEEEAPPDAEPSNPIPPDAGALSQPQSSSGEEEAPIPEEEEAPIPDEEALSQPQSSSGEEEAPIPEEEEAPIPEENREEKKEELHPEWPDMDERLEKILEEKSTRLLDCEFNQLTEIQRKCLLCFSVFEPNSEIKKQNMNSKINNKPNMNSEINKPNMNSEIKKQNMIYWWIGEGFAKPSGDITAEEDGEQIFQQLVERGFIEPIRNSCTDTIHECRVQPFVHWMVKKKAREASFCDLDERGKPSAELSTSPRLCLTSETKPSLSSPVSNSSKTDEVTVMFNVSKQSYRSQFYEFLINFKSLVVLQLGRWSSNAKYHIEVEGFENLKNIGLLTNLRYLGLQGLSRLTTLPPEIKKLKCLLILDLRGCQYLEKVGKDATYLERLTRLDLTECYMLEHIATGFGSLSELQVFKGFVFGGSRDRNRCRLAELSKLTKLKKLSINITSEANIDNDEMNVLNKFQSVRSLTITWGAIPTIDDSETIPILKKWNALKLQLPPKIEKFDMRCFPCEEMPNWLGLEKLKTLYIRGGKLQTLRPENGPSETAPENGSSETAFLYPSIERLRLKYLVDFDMEWANIREMMPNLDRLEFVECGQLRSPPPLDRNHVWIRDKKDEENDHVPPVAPVAPSPTTPETAPDETAMGDDATEAAAAAAASDEEITTEPGTAAASNEETTAEPALHRSPTNEATEEIVAASEEEEEIITAESALQDLSAASTSAVANTTNNSTTNATIETPSNPGVVPATYPPGAAVGDEEGNPLPTSRSG